MVGKEEVEWGWDDVAQTFALLRQAGMTPKEMRWIRQRQGVNAVELLEFLRQRAAGKEVPLVTHDLPEGTIVISPADVDVEQARRARISEVDGIFPSPEEQIRWLISYTDAHLAPKPCEIPDPPDLPEGALQSVVLCHGRKTLAETAHFAWHFMKKRLGSNGIELYRHGAIEFKSGQIGLLRGAEHRRGFYWSVVDVGCLIDDSPTEVATPESSPGVELLFLAAYAPGWIKLMNTQDIPNVWLPGLCVHMSSGDSATLKMYVDRSRKGRLSHSLCLQYGVYAPPQVNHGSAVPVRLA